jgi:hypothetical protein
VTNPLTLLHNMGASLRLTRSLRNWAKYWWLWLSLRRRLSCCIESARFRCLFKSVCLFCLFVYSF